MNGTTIVALWILGCGPTAVSEPAAAAEPNRPAWWQMDLLPPREEAVVGEGLVGRFYWPARGNPPWPVAVLLGGAQGGLITARDRIEPLVASGYCVLTVAYFKAQGLPEELASVPLEFHDRAKAWLAKDARVVQGGVALIGSSKGGELALLLASRDPYVRCVVGIVPASHVFQGIAARSYPGSSWSYEGKDLPFVPFRAGPALFRALATREFHEVYQEALAGAGTAAEPARIRVEKTQGAVLLLSARKDEMWPSTTMCDDIVARLKKESFPHACKHVVYDTGHNVGSSRAHWIEITTFLHTHYGIPPRTAP
jgi:dienelactone hydrolase